MKKLISTFMILAVATLTMAATALQPSKAISLITGKEMPLEKMVPTQRDVEKTDDATLISYHIENIILEPDSLFTGAYKCVISDFGSSFAEGAPALPMRRDIVELPYGCDTATVTVTKATYVDIPCELAPAYPFWIGKKPSFTREVVGEIATCNFGSQNDIVTIDEFTTQKDRRIANLLIAPCQYNSSEKKIRIYTDVEYTVDYGSVDQEKVMARRVAKATRYAASRKAIATAAFDLLPIDSVRPSLYPPKPEDAVYYPALDDNVGPYVYNYYQIVTTTKYRAAAEEFAAFKRQFGYTTHISCRSRWNTTMVKDSIQAYFDNVVHKSQYYDYDNYYVLIIGGHSDVPAMNDDITIVDGNNRQRYDFITDYYYGCVSSYNPKVKIPGIGRVPARNLAEATIALNKIKNYTLNPPTENRFYRTGAHIANYDAFIYEVDGFIYSSEDTRNRILSTGLDIDITRLYNARPDATPIYYGRDATSKYELPEELKKPNYHWNANRDSIAKELKKGCFYTLYRGHGDTTAFCDPNLTTSDIKNLFDNGDKLPVFFNFTCSTGTFNKPDCFAETLLKQENGGGVGVYAATVPTNHYDNCALVNTILPTALWDTHISLMYDNPHYISQDGESAQPCELNKMLTKALDNYPSSYTNQEQYRFFHKTAYHIFGDPSMWMWIGKPREYTDSEVWVNPHYTNTGLSKVEILINLLDERCYVAIEDKETHEVTLEYGNILTYPEFDAKRYNMTIFGLNRIPKVISVPEDNGGGLSTKSTSLTISPNPASTSCLIGYHNNVQCINTYSGTITITNVSTGTQRDKIWVKEHVGRIELDVSKYPNGTYLVTFTPSKTSSSGVVLGNSTAQLIVKH